MNRFFRTAYSTALLFFFLTLFAVVICGARMPFPAFSCLFFGLLVFLMPGFARRLEGREIPFMILGAVIALAGELFILLCRCPAAYYFVYAAALLGAALFIVLLSANTTYNDFEAKFRFTLVIAAVATAFIAVAGLSDSAVFNLKAENVVAAINCLVPIAIVMLAMGILLLRGLRAQPGIVDDRAFNRRQLRDTLIFGGIVTAVFVVDPVKAIKAAFDWLVHNALRKIYYWLYDMFGKFVELITVPHGSTPSATAVATAAPSEAVSITPLPELEPIEQEVPPQSEPFFRTLTVFFMILVGLILLYIVIKELVKLIRKLRSKSDNKSSGYPNEIREELPPEEEQPEEDKPSKRSRDPRDRMRLMYAEFMRRLRRKSVPISRTDTCGEIGVHAKTASPGESSEIDEFTGLYEKARYDLAEEPAESDAQRMKKLLGEIKER